MSFIRTWHVIAYGPINILRLQRQLFLELLWILDVCFTNYLKCHLSGLDMWTLYSLWSYQHFETAKTIIISWTSLILDSCFTNYLKCHLSEHCHALSYGFMVLSTFWDYKDNVMLTLRTCDVSTLQIQDTKSQNSCQLAAVIYPVAWHSWLCIYLELYVQYQNTKSLSNFRMPL